MSDKHLCFRYGIRLDDLDYMGIVGNAQWLILLERTRFDALAALGYPATRMFADGIGGVVAEANIKYMRPARLDDEVTIDMSAKDPDDTSVTLEYAARNRDGKPYIKASTRMVFVGKDGRPTAMPSILRDGLFAD